MAIAPLLCCDRTSPLLRSHLSSSRTERTWVAPGQSFDGRFGELIRAGELRTTPRLFCAQPLACSPIATAIQKALGRNDGKRVPDEWNVPTKTMAEGTSIQVPSSKL